MLIGLRQAGSQSQSDLTAGRTMNIIKSRRSKHIGCPLTSNQLTLTFPWVKKPEREAPGYTPFHFTLNIRLRIAYPLTDSVRGYSKKKCSTYVHFQLFRILFIVFEFLFASLLSLSCNRRSRMSGEDRRLACAHAHVNAINPAFKAR